MADKLLRVLFQRLKVAVFSQYTVRLHRLYNSSFLVKIISIILISLADSHLKLYTQGLKMHCTEKKTH